MKTEKLYDLDSHLYDFSATVIDCRKNFDKYEIILDKTAFFPEGGGQLADTGNIASANITDVQINNGIITHYSDSPVDVGTTVECQIDAPKRFRRMQNHSGEHIVSGIVHNLFGYDNVGFHLGDDVTIDFNGELSDEQLTKVEKLANEAIYKNVRFICEYPDEETLKTLNYRSKLDLTEDVRIVTIEGYDVCACCAPHVKTSGEIGIIKILDHHRHRGGIRIHLLCGFDALEDYGTKYRNLYAVANALCSKQNETAQAFEKYAAEHSELKAEIAALKRELTKLKAASLNSTDDCVLIFENDLPMNDLRCLVLKGAEKAEKLCAGFSGNDNSGYNFAVASQKLDLRNYSKDITSALNGKGGGSSELIQGSVKAAKQDIEDYFKNNF